MADDLRVEKRQQQVRLVMADEMVIEATVFLSNYAMHHSGEQNVLDLLLEDDPFLPAKAGNGEFHLVRKGMVCHVCCPVDSDPALEYTERNVRICFLGGAVLEGVIKMDLPPQSARLTDYINGGAEFFPLFSTEESFLVNRSLIRDLVLID